MVISISKVMVLFRNTILFSCLFSSITQSAFSIPSVKGASSIRADYKPPSTDPPPPPLPSTSSHYYSNFTKNQPSTQG